VAGFASCLWGSIPLSASVDHEKASTLIFIFAEVESFDSKKQRQSAYHRFTYSGLPNPSTSIATKGEKFQAKKEEVSKWQ
jgi:hypothetical protein